MTGARVGNYTIVEKLGQGGMGTVYRARHATLGRSAAVKLLPPVGPNHHEFIARLFNEARLTTAVGHPGVVEVHDVDLLPDQTAYIVMEYLEGENLAEKLARQRGVPYLRALQIVREVARILHAVHERGIIHRDLKPDNIFLVRDPASDSGERVKLLDFGIAKCAGERDLALTQVGAIVGTPPYMSPEQCRGGPIDRRADLYSLGCVLYELVCGRPPFIGASASEIIAHHLYFVPRPPSSFDERVPAALESLILWLLHKEPRHRPPTAAHVVAAIDDLDGETLAGLHPRTQQHAAPADTLPMIDGTSVYVASTTARTSQRTRARGSRPAFSARCRGRTG
jgi:serine/threonine-protein kinase